MEELILFHGFYRNHHNFVTAFLTNVCFAAGASKTVAARTFEMFLIPGFAAVGTGNFYDFFVHTKTFSGVLNQNALISLAKPKMITWVKIMVAPEGMSAKYETSRPINEARKAKPTE